MDRVSLGFVHVGKTTDLERWPMRGRSARATHGATPVWMTVTICPAIFNVPALAANTTLAAILMFTVAVPVPLAPEVTVIHGSLLTATQKQPLCVVTVKGVPAPAL